MMMVLRRWRPVVLAACLTGVGYLLHESLPPVPRWSIRVPESADSFGRMGTATVQCKFSDDGRKVAGVFHYSAPPGFGVGYFEGPLRLWDVSTGEDILRSARAGHYYGFAWDAKGRRAASVFQVGKPAPCSLHVFDLHQGESIEVVLPDALYYHLVFSPDSDWLLFHASTAANDRESRILGTFHIPSRRLQHVELRADSISFSPNGSFALVMEWEADRNGYAIWQRDPLKKVAFLENRHDAVVHPQGSWVLVSPSDRAYWEFWDLADMGKPSLKASIPREGWSRAFFGPLGDVLVILEPFSLKLLEMPNGKLRWHIPSSRGEHVRFDSRQRHVALHQGQAHRATSVALFDTQTGRQTSEFPTASFRRECWTFADDNALLLHCGFQKTVLLDSATGIEHFVFPWHDDADAAIVFATADGRRALVQGGGFRLRNQEKARGWGERFFQWLESWFKPSDPLGLLKRETSHQVIDLEAGNILLELNAVGEGRSFLSDDGKSLLVQENRSTEGTTTLHCFDVPARKPWAWIIGVPVGIGVCVVAWKWLRRKRRAAPSQAGGMLSP